MKDIVQIEIDKAKELLSQNATFVDVRDPRSYEAAHIPGASRLSDENLEEFIEKSDKKKPVVVYCYRGNASQGGAAYLMEQGFEEVYSLIGGFEGWKMKEKIES
jgi:thiosulfate sulfurtransferase